MNNMAEVPIVVVSPEDDVKLNSIPMPDGREDVPETSLSSIGSPENLHGNILTNIKKCSQSLYPARVITEYLRIFQCEPTSPTLKDIPEMSKLIFDLADRNDLVKFELLKNVCTIGMLSTKLKDNVPEFENIVGEYIIPFTVNNIIDRNIDIMNVAQQALLGLLEHGSITNFQAEIQVCPTVLAATKMSWANGDVQFITFMSHMVPLLGRDTTERVFLERFVELCESNDFVLRKSSASNIGNFCNVAGKNTFDNKLLPCYIKLCNDDNWRVRKACAEVTMSISHVCTPQQRQTILAPTFVKLLDDSSRWVQTSAFQVLGPFISTFAEAYIINMYNNNVDKLDIENRNKTTFYNPFAKDEPPFDVDFNYVYDEDLFGVCKRSSPGRDIPNNNNNNNNNNIEFANCPFNDVFQYGGRNVDFYNDNTEYNENVTIVNNKYRMIDDNNSIGETKLNVNDINLQTETENDDVYVEEETRVDISDIENASGDSNVTKVNHDHDSVEDVKSIIDDLICEANVNGNHVVDDESVEEQKTVVAQDEEENKEDTIEIDTSSSTKINNVESDEILAKNLDNNLEPKKHVCDNNVIQELSNRTNTSLIITEKSNSSSSSSYSHNEGVNTNCKRSRETTTCDDLQSYNSYYYWFVDPNMPLDPILVNSNKYGTEHVSTSRVEDSLLSLIGNGDVTKEKKLIYKQDVVPQILIDHFVSMTRPELAQNIDHEIALYCAYSLPAVVLTLGGKNWNVLKDTTELLATFAQYKVRKTIACSLHDLALILGPDLASDSLIPIFDAFIQDVDEVRIGILKNLANFLRSIKPDKRPLCLPRLNKFLHVDNELNWRLKYELAEQLLLATPLFSPMDSARYIGRIGMTLLRDKVAAVREMTIKLMAEVIKYISLVHHITQGILVRLAEGFGHSKSWKRRQTYAMLCSELLTNTSLSMEQYSSDVLPHFIDLSWDPVANVRLVVAKIISKDIVSNKFYEDPVNQYVDLLQSIIRRLQNDSDRDVKYAATATPPVNPINVYRDVLNLSNN